VYDAFVLAAGFGTRLRPLTLHKPKPLVPVCGVPMLSYALALCARHGLRSVVVNAHHLADQLLPWAGEHEGVRVEISVEEPEILGTGGGLRAVRDRLADRFAVVNADVLCDVDLGALLAATPDHGAAMALRPHPESSRYGVVAADSTGTVVQLVHLATAPPHGVVDASTHFTGVYAMDRVALERIPPGFACVVRTALQQMVPERLVAGLRHPGLWLDVGDPEAYLAANLAALGGLSLPLDPFPRAGWARGEREVGDPGLVEGVRVEGPAWVGQGARVGEGVRLSHAVVGPGAEVPAGADLERVVVWEGLRVPPTRLRDAVVFPGGVLEVG